MKISKVFAVWPKHSWDAVVKSLALAIPGLMNIGLTNEWSTSKYHHESNTKLRTCVVDGAGTALNGRASTYIRVPVELRNESRNILTTPNVHRGIELNFFCSLEKLCNTRKVMKMYLVSKTLIFIGFLSCLLYICWIGFCFGLRLIQEPNKPAEYHCCCYCFINAAMVTSHTRVELYAATK